MRKWIPFVLTVVGCGRLGFDHNQLAGDDAPLGDGNPMEVDGTVEDGTVTGDATTDTLVVAFTTLPNTNSPTARRSSGAATAPDDRIWIYGGFNTGGAQAGVAAYTPGTGIWNAPVVTGAPPERERHALAFDAANDRLVLFGGFSGTFPLFTHHDELFIFSPTTNAWTQIPKAGTWPAPRKDAMMVWVPSLGQLLLYGGNNGSGAANRFGELWLLSIDVGTSTATWTAVTPGGVAPPRQSAPCVGYDPNGRRFLIHGGETQDGNDASTTYQYLLDPNEWQLDTTTGTSPGARSFSHCAWDPAIGRLVLYGGQSSGTPVAGTYIYEPTGKQWEMFPVNLGSISPGNLSDGGATYSPELGGVFMFGGRSAGTTYTNQAWLIDVKPQ